MNIVEKIRADGETGAALLEREYKARLTAVAVRCCGDRHEAEALVYRTFDEVVRRIDTLKNDELFFSWMCGILTNTYSASIRRKSHEMISYTDHLPEDAADDLNSSRIYEMVDSALLRDAIKKLPEKQREAILLYYFMDMPIWKIAKFLTIPVGTVASRIRLAREALKARLVDSMKKPMAAAVCATFLMISAFGAGWLGGVSYATGGSAATVAADTPEENASPLGERASPPAPTGEENDNYHNIGGASPVQMEEENLLPGGRDARSPNVPVNAKTEDQMVSKAKNAVLAAVLAASPALHASTAPRSVFDDAAMWWRFDNGGENGSVATTAQIHDARDAAESSAVPTELYGPAGGPIWTNVTFRLPNKGVMTSGTALFTPCEKSVVGSTPKAYGSGVNFGACPLHSNDVTFVARVCLAGEEVSAKEQILFNNGFGWGQSVGHMFGFSRFASSGGASEYRYHPHVYSGQASFGTTEGDDRLWMKAGSWYDVAYVQQTGADGTDTVTFVVSDARSGFRTQTMRKPTKRNRGEGLTTYNSYIGRWDAGIVKGSTTYNLDLSQNSSDNFKAFNGAVHQMAIWGRALSLDEIREAFGEHVEPENALADAAEFLRFDADPDGDGVFSLSDVRDVRRWRDPAPGDAATACGGPVGGPAWTNMAVSLPAAGIVVTNDCLWFPVATNAYVNGDGHEIHAAYPTFMKLGKPPVAGSMTLVARVYPLCNVGAHAHESINGAYAFFYSNGYHWQSASGSEFGLQSLADYTGNTFCPAVLIAQSWYRATALTMQTNTWYDIAFSVTDNGVDSEGNELADSLLVAVCDEEHGIRTQTINISTNAFSLYSFYRDYVVAGAESATDAGGFTDFWNATTEKLVNGASSVKAFNGMIHKLAVWPRALSLDEIAEAFGNPLALFSVGMADGSGAEFAGADDGRRDCEATTPWHDVAGRLDAAHPSLTLRFSVPEKNAGLAYAFRVLTAAEDGLEKGAMSSLSLFVNGKSIGGKTVAAGDEQWWFVNKSIVDPGANSMTLTYAGGAPAVVIDKVEMSGSWQLNEPYGDLVFSQEGKVGNVFYVGDRNLSHVTRAVTNGRRTNQVRFYLPKFLAEKHPFDFSFGVWPGSGEAGFSMSVNGVEKSSRAGDLGKWQDRTDTMSTIQFVPGELKAGWNVIEPLWTGPSSWCEFMYYRLFMRDYKHGTMMIVR